MAKNSVTRTPKVGFNNQDAPVMLSGWKLSPKTKTVTVVIMILNSLLLFFNSVGIMKLGNYDILLAIISSVSLGVLISPQMAIWQRVADPKSSKPGA